MDKERDGTPAEEAACKSTKIIDLRKFVRDANDDDGRLVWDFYEKVGDLGEGGCGDVTLARQRLRVGTAQEREGRFVAIKRVRKIPPPPKRTLAAVAHSVVAHGAQQSKIEEASNEIKCVTDLESDAHYLSEIEDMRTEVELMKSLDHPNICRLLQVFEDRTNTYLVMEHIKGGELFDFIDEMGSFGEDDAAEVVRQVSSALTYCHGHGVVHRDIKPENIMLVNQEEGQMRLEVKVIDFGYGSRLLRGAHLRAKVGTLSYSPPEVLEGEPCNEKVDLWALGCVLFVMLSGKEPFGGRDVRSRIMQGMFSLEHEAWDLISEEAKSLVRALLTVKPAERLSAEEVLKTKWLAQHMCQAEPEKKVILKHVKNLKSFRSEGVFQQLCSALLARQMDETTLHELHNTFTALDTNGDGILTQEEFMKAFRDLEARALATGGSADNDDDEGLESITSTIELKSMYKAVDMNCNGVIDYTEFIAACVGAQIRDREEVCWAAWSVFDQNADGLVSFKELQQVLNSLTMQKTFSRAALAEVWNTLKGNKDGNGGAEEYIDFDQFLLAIRGIHLSEMPEALRAPILKSPAPPSRASTSSLAGMLPIARRGSCEQSPQASPSAALHREGGRISFNLGSSAVTESSATGTDGGEGSCAKVPEPLDRPSSSDRRPSALGGLLPIARRQE